MKEKSEIYQRIIELWNFILSDKERSESIASLAGVDEEEFHPVKNNTRLDTKTIIYDGQKIEP